MFTYIQNVYDINLKYIEEDFEYSINCFKGKRQESGKQIKVTSFSKEKADLEINLNFKPKEFNDLKNLLKSIKYKLKKKNIKFSAILTLHNETVIINKVTDHRYYGLIRLILKDSLNNTIMEDISILNRNLEELENKISVYIKKYIKNIPNEKLNTNKIFFQSIPVILSPQASGYFAHEILGHLLEEDFYDYYGKNYKNLVASKKLTILDSVENCTSIIGLNKYDDIGIPIKPLTLLKKGKLVNILSTNKNKSLDKKIYGVSRRENYKHTTIPRMRGTFILPHDNINVKDIINKYTSAIFLNKSYLGGIDPSAGMYTLSGDGFYIKNGEKRNFISNLKLTGNIKNDLSAIDYIGNDFKMFGSYCIKLDQTVRVGMGGPTISLNGTAIEGNIYGKL